MRNRASKQEGKKERKEKRKKVTNQDEDLKKEGK